MKLFSMPRQRAIALWTPNIRFPKDDSPLACGAWTRIAPILQILSLNSYFLGLLLHNRESTYAVFTGVEV